EDGIRDKLVTGVQTCALPISVNAYCPRHILVTGGAGFIGCHLVRHFLRTDPQTRVVTLDLLTYAGSLKNLADLPGPDRHCFVQRSEERRVGKEVRVGVWAAAY